MKNGSVQVTVVGWAGSTPREVMGDGVPFSSFRMSTRERRFDARTGQWVDGRTEWFTVKAFRDLAFNVAASIRVSDPVVVTGRLRTEEWQGKDGTRTGFVIEADSVGHDLARGTSRFARTVRRSPAGEVLDPEDSAAEPEPEDGDEPEEGVSPVPGGRADEVDPWAVPADGRTDEAEAVRTP